MTLALDDEVIDHILLAGVKALRQSGGPLQFAAPRMPGGHGDASPQHGGTWIEARALAQFYAGLFSDLASAGKPPADSEVHDANNVLEEHGWAVEKNDLGQYDAVDLSQEEHQDGPVQHKRVAKGTPGAKRRVFGGGGPLSGKEYWVSADTPEPRQSVAARKGAYAQQNTPDAARLHEETQNLLAQHQSEHDETSHTPQHELVDAGRKRAQAGYRFLERTYGEHAPHRINEMLGWVKEALKASEELPADGAFKTALRQKLFGQLRRLHVMAESAKGGQGGKTPPAREKAAEPPAQAPGATGEAAGKPEYPADWSRLIPRYTGELAYTEGQRAKIIDYLKQAQDEPDAQVEKKINELEALKGTKNWGRTTHPALNGLYVIRSERMKVGAWNPEAAPAPAVKPEKKPARTSKQAAPPATEAPPAATPAPAKAPAQKQPAAAPPAAGPKPEPAAETPPAAAPAPTSATPPISPALRDKIRSGKASPENVTLAQWRAAHDYDRQTPRGKESIDAEHRTAVRQAIAAGRKPDGAKDHPEAAPAAQIVSRPPTGERALASVDALLKLEREARAGKAGVDQLGKSVDALDLAGHDEREIRQVAKALQIPGAHTQPRGKLEQAIRSKVLAPAAVRAHEELPDLSEEELQAEREAQGNEQEQTPAAEPAAPGEVERPAPKGTPRAEEGPAAGAKGPRDKVTLRPSAGPMAKEAASAVERIAGSYPDGKIPIGAIREGLKHLSREQQDAAIKEMIGSGFHANGDRSIYPEELTSLHRTQELTGYPTSETLVAGLPGARPMHWGWISLRNPREDAAQESEAPAQTELADYADELRGQGKSEEEIAQKLGAIRRRRLEEATPGKKGTQAPSGKTGLPQGTVPAWTPYSGPEKRELGDDELAALTDVQLGNLMRGGPLKEKASAEYRRRVDARLKGDDEPGGYDYGVHPGDVEDYPEWKVPFDESPGLTAFLNRAFFAEKPGGKQWDKTGKWNGPERDAWEAKKTREYQDAVNGQKGLFAEPAAEETPAPASPEQVKAEADADRRKVLAAMEKAPRGRPLPVAASAAAKSLVNDVNAALTALHDSGLSSFDREAQYPELRKSLVPRINALDLSGASVADLRDLAKSLGAEPRGNKAALIYAVKHALFAKLNPQSDQAVYHPDEPKMELPPQPTGPAGKAPGKAAPTPAAASVPAAAQPAVARIKALQEEMLKQAEELGRRGTAGEAELQTIRSHVARTLDEMNLEGLPLATLREVARATPGADPRGGKAELIAGIRNGLHGLLPGHDSGGKQPPGETAAPTAPTLEPASETNVPPGRREKLAGAIAKIKDFNDELQRMKDLEKKVGGHGRYQSELREKRRKELEEAAKTIEDTRKTAESKGIDLQPLLDQMGYAPPVPPGAEEEGWGPEEATPPENAAPALETPEETPGEEESPPTPSEDAAGATPEQEAQTKAHVDLASALAEKLGNGETITSADLRKLAAEHFGGTMAEGAAGYSEIGDALEAGFNKSLQGRTDPGHASLAVAQDEARSIEARVQALPTQTNRSGEKETHQQFSTPPHYAFAAAWLAKLTDKDHVLEPSAGTGSLAVQAANTGAEVYVNELSDRRADFLRDLFGSDRVHVGDAEQVSATLPGRGVPRPTAVIMNPPFSQTAGRLGDKKDLLTGARHVEEALKFLAPGGRLVAIVGGGMTPDSSHYRAFFAKMAGKYNLRANVGVAGEEYAKYGTRFGTRVLVFDKTPPTGAPAVTGEAADIPDLMAKLQEVRDDRPQVAGQPPGQPAGAAVAGEGQGAAAGGDDAAPGVPGGVAAPAPGERLRGPGQLPRRGEAASAGAVPGQEPGGLGGDAGGRLPAAPGGPAGAESGPVAGPERPPGEPAAGNEGGANRRGRGKGAGGKPVRQPASPAPGFRPAKRVAIRSVAPTPTDEPVGKPDEHGPQEETTQADLGASLYEGYRPQLLQVPGSKKHATPLVESSAMAAVHPPKPTYEPTLPPEIVDNGILSEAQLESLVYAGQAHERFLPSGGVTLQNGHTVYPPDDDLGENGHNLVQGEDGRFSLTGTNRTFDSLDSAQRWLSANNWLARATPTSFRPSPIPTIDAFRRGYFIGDGTGVGKGRQIAGVIADNWHQGRTKHVWLSEKQTLLQDAHRDLAALGMTTHSADQYRKDENLIHFDRLRKAKDKPEKGIAFITYDTLKGKPKDPAAKSNLDQLVEWLGPDFDGVIAMDEAHGMANGIAQQGGRGLKDASQKALAGIRLQQMLPKARILYVSATGATEVSNLAYAERLGLWGRGTPFAEKAQFFDQMDKGGVAAMEAVAQSLKAMGGYNARSLSFDDGTPEGKVTYERLTHALSDDQKAQYDACADGWQVVLQNIDKALEATGGSEDKNARSAALSQFWGAQQRFFNQVMTSMQTPSVLAAMKKDIAEGRAPVVQVVNTGEAAMKRALAERDEDEDLEELDLSPRQVLMQYLEKAFPVHRYEEYKDASGEVQTRVVRHNPLPFEQWAEKEGHDLSRLDDKGRRLLHEKYKNTGDPVVDPEAAAMRDEMVLMAGTLKIPESPLDMILNAFGPEKVAEATGRTQRMVMKEDQDGNKKPQVERRNINTANAADAAAFQNGDKHILIFSDAGGTGRSYHADKEVANQKQRVHYMLQPGWRADRAVQGIGRTHRTNQAQAPTYRLVEIAELKAQKRFISTIARRLDQLGALTKGQRQAGGGGLFSAADNLEGPLAREAMSAFFRDLATGRVAGLSHDDVITQLGLKKPNKVAEAVSRRGRGGAQQTPEPDSMGQFLNRLLSLRVDMQARVFDAFDQRLKAKVEQAVRDGKLDTGVENFPAERMTKVSDQTIYRDHETGAEVRHVATKARVKAEKKRWHDLDRSDAHVGFVKSQQTGKVFSVAKTVDKTDEKGNVTQQYRLQGPTRVEYVPQHAVNGYYSRYENISEEEAHRLWGQEYDEAPEYKEFDEHFVTGALLPIWDRIPGETPKIYRLKTDDGQTVVGRHVPRKLVDGMLRAFGVGGQNKSHDPGAVHAQLEKGQVKAVLANGWRLERRRVQHENRIELKGGKESTQQIGPAQLGQLRADGVIVERIGGDIRFFVPTGAAGAAVMARLTQHRPIVEVDDAEGAQRYMRTRVVQTLVHRENAPRFSRATR